MAFAKEQGLDSGRDELDLGYVGHAWLKAAFGDYAPRPWRLFMPTRLGRGHTNRILAYSAHSHGRLADHMCRFASPLVEAVCPPEAIQGKALPQEWPAKRRYAFEVLCCPVGRKAGSGQEKDVFLIEADHNASSEKLERSAVYRRWFKRQLDSISTVQLLEVELEGFRLSKIFRKTRAQNGQRKLVRRIRPQAGFRGVLETTDEGAGIVSLLKQGVGRHRAFGFGMILLRPA